MESRKSQVSKYTEWRLNALLGQKDVSAGKAALAELRRGIGHAPGDLPKLWGVFLAGMPQDMHSRDGVPSREEWAIYIALTLWALHQQGNDASMHRSGVSLGSAAAMLPEKRDDMERVWRRLNAVARAEDMAALSHHLRGLVQLLKAEDIGMDYAALAGDLYEFQRAETRPGVRLRWGEDFFQTLDKRFVEKKPDETTEKEDTPDENE